MSHQDHGIVISLANQTLSLMENGCSVATYPISSARKGMGNQPHSHRTPTGNFRVAKKIGGDLPLHTIFKGRVPVGTWNDELTEEDLILSRILWLDGLDATNRNTMDRYIYIHGTNHEGKLGTPASQGCIRLGNEAILAVFEWVHDGIRVEISPAPNGRAKLCFLDCDSTLSTIEGIDELARARGPEVLEKVEALTNAAMNGEIPISEVFPRRMDLIRPDHALCEEVAQNYIDRKVEGSGELVDLLKIKGWTPVILSGGFAPLIEPLAAHLGIADIEAMPLQLNENGEYVDFGRDYPTTRNHGKNQIIREWKEALLPERTIMIGDGISDLETKSDVDLFVGFGGVVERKAVKQSAGLWLNDFQDHEELGRILDLP